MLVLVEMDLHAVYMDMKKSSVHNVNEYSMHSISTNKILSRVVDSVNDTFQYLVVDPMVPRPTSLKDYWTVEHVLD